MKKKITYNYYQQDFSKVLKNLGQDAVEDLRQMLLIRNFEARAEAAYMQGKIGGFFHTYTGQEAIQTAAVRVFGKDQWYTTTYRCHALAILLDAGVDEVMAELYGKETGNAKGRGGSMHLYNEQLLGGFGIVGGHVPVATGAAFSIKYQNQDKVSLCFLGDGSMAQGAFHEALNYASLWDLPCIYIIENNQWGMGTEVSRAICSQPLAESFAPAYSMESFTINGMDYIQCYAAFKEMKTMIKKNSRPILVEAVTERFKGHSISDPGLYRSKEDVKKAMAKDPIAHLKDELIKENIITQKLYEDMNEAAKNRVIAALKFAEESPFPDPVLLEEGVMDWEGV